MLKNRGDLRMRPDECAPAQRVGHPLGNTGDLAPLMAVFDILPFVFVVLDAGGKIACFNEAFAILTGDAESGRREALGLDLGEALGCIHALEARGRCGAAKPCRDCGILPVVRGADAGTGTGSAWECRIIRSNMDGIVERLDFRLWSIPLPLDIGGRSDPERYTAVCALDVSREKRGKILERTFFHNILNVTGVLRGLTELLVDERVTDKEDLQTSIHGLSMRLIEEVEAQRELTLAENGELTVRPVRINSLELLRQVAQRCRKHDSARERRIEIDAGATDSSFVSDPELLAFSLDRIVMSALEASRPGHTVTLGCKAVSDCIEISVHVPMFLSPDVQLQILQRAWSTRSSSMWLQIYPVKHAAEYYLQGRISLKASEEGTSFIFAHPLEPAQPGL